MINADLLSFTFGNLQVTVITLTDVIKICGHVVFTLPSGVITCKLNLSNKSMVNVDNAVA